MKFPPRVLSDLRAGNVLGVRAGPGEHRIIGIWMVMVGDRVFARSWSLKPRSWWRTFAQERVGAIRIGDRLIAVRGVATRSARLLDAVDRAYGAKYTTPSALKYVKDMCRERSRRTTTEFVPRSTRPGGRAKRALRSTSTSRSR